MSKQYKLGKTYSPAEFEKHISLKWLDSGSFHAVPDHKRQSYVIMMPLPNVTGALHMGHAMDNVMQDMLIRWHRMKGDVALWMPGTDHAGIATQAVVEKRLKELEGLTRHNVGREGLVERIWKWKDQFQARIVEQQQRMGCSADWERQRFTMDAVCSRAVRHTFFRMFRDGLIFRGKRLVNWDSFLQTSISDDEVYHETVQGFFWHLHYPVIDPGPNDPATVVVATTRPETMLGDTAVAVHPDPKGALEEDLEKLKQDIKKAPAREKAQIEAQIADIETRLRDKLSGLLHLRDMARDKRKVLLPLLNRSLPLILDEWAKPSMGTGCVKVTPAHDPNDYEVWIRHKQEIDIINILNPDGTLNENAGPYAGLDRYEARNRVVSDLKEQGLMGDIEDRQIEIGHSDRSKTPIEPYLSDQWFIKMGDIEDDVVMGRGTSKEHRSSGLVQAAIDAVRQGRVSFHPERFVKTYLDWLEEKRDWPISRQLWWGHRIPVWSRTVEKKDLEDILAKIIEKVLKDMSHKGAGIRVVNKETGWSRLVDGSFDISRLKDVDEGLFWIDVCLLNEDKELETLLDSLGLMQDPDVLDTWFSSAIWPHSTLGWPDPATADTEGGAPLGPQNGQPDCLTYFYPGSCLVTGRDIITLWVARMIITGLYNMGDVPFTDVFIHANILDGKGERMSKSKGNGIDPVDIIETYGVDAMRFILCDMQTGNQDIRLPVTAICPQCGSHNDLAAIKHGRSVFTYLCSDCKAEFDVLGTMPDTPAAKLISERFADGSKFCNKLWNTARFALGHLVDVPKVNIKQKNLTLEDRWILSALNRTIREVSKALEDYNPSNALSAARDFMWGELCDWYLELIKPRLAETRTETARVALQVLAACLDQTLRLLHPFVPFITEYLYLQLNKQVPERGLPGLTKEEKISPMLITASWPQPVASLDDPFLMRTFADLQAATCGVRELRASHGISPHEKIIVTLKPSHERCEDLKSRAHVIERLARIDKLHIDPSACRPRGSASKVVGDLSIYVHDIVDDVKEKERLQREIQNLEKEIDACSKKLSNEHFINRAPAEVVQKQKNRLSVFKKQKEAVVKALEELFDEGNYSGGSDRL
ncbi:MAG: valine--tRNA ligase [Candidatus Aminicenantes bacterium]|nr:valine--tRNA ligase [Candidatus Aminicenantes bacterium]